MRITGNPVVKDAIPRTCRIIQNKRRLNIVADIPVGVDVFPGALNSFRRKTIKAHAKADLITVIAIKSLGRPCRLAADDACIIRIGCCPEANGHNEKRPHLSRI